MYVPHDSRDDLGCTSREASYKQIPLLNKGGRITLRGIIVK
ncbi:hypothetical protein N665_0809s0045 [Sinapis alba]|nr:hypothetical protein N665_0809s0045 [Sinapis alba]